MAADGAITGKRLFSLDVLRGFDMLILLYGSVIAWSMEKVEWWPRWILTQFSHPWGVYTLFDIVQPLFAFVCGAAIPLALAKRMEGARAGRSYWRHVFSRFALLYFLGALFSGLLRLDPASLPFFGNTLQLLGFGYLFAAICYAKVPRKAWPWAMIGLVAAWGVALHLGGDMTQEGNLSVKIERAILRLFVKDAHPHNTSWATIPMFCALTLLGAFTIGFLRDETRSAARRANALLAAGAAVALGGIAVHFVQPEIKHIYTPAYTLISAGISLFLLGAFYWIFDILCLRRCTWIFLLYGRWALASYVLWGFFGKYCTQAAEGLLGPFNRLFVPADIRPLVNTAGTLFLSTGLLWLWSAARSKNR